ncbi:epidermal retinol dehydrogenase 2-like [Plasmopara halstedii]|uniref:Short-chain dehydrogenase/reductase 3 n=1 Tax=Plasmopara halstedii TaxID=4781 RepID=A0A0P1AV92_PLAHL|nr:epidermal retinol dehydrogenase 2-like [Plasmopara halstedii]CEG46298.1 epidermal retinol dehydrogenase 2-like [Plasmopara halstedii]|eukprot:XP_024582667.1 epidermal retinol dehydrogenase 2-like [Plasmopara halstedii]
MFNWIWPQKPVTGDVVLITGGAMGIGRLMALRFASLGAIVIIWDLHSKFGHKVVQEIEAINGKAEFYKVDVTHREQVYATGEQVLKKFKSVDILINNAGIVGGRPLLESSDAMIERTFAVNAISHFWTIKTFLPIMKERNKGHIVSIASAAGIFGSPGMVDYGASKFAAIGLLVSLRQELLAAGLVGVHTTVVCPGFIETGMFEGVKPPFYTRWLSPEYIADQIVAAVRRNQWRVLLPSILGPLEFVAVIMPMWFVDWFTRITKTSQAMDTFKQTRNYEFKDE